MDLKENVMKRVRKHYKKICGKSSLQKAGLHKYGQYCRRMY